MEVGRDTYPDINFLKSVRKICNKEKIVLIFDECTTGFREHYGGLHMKYRIYPDMAMFGKSIGNGYAITSIIGKKKIMNCFNNTFASSTFWSEKIGFVASVATLKKMKKIKSWDKIKEKGALIKKKLLKLADKHKLNMKFTGMDSLIKFSISSVSDTNLNKFIADEMIKRDFLSGNRLYVSLGHTDKTIIRYIHNMDIVLKKLKKKFKI